MKQPICVFVLLWVCVPPAWADPGKAGDLEAGIAVRESNGSYLAIATAALALEQMVGDAIGRTGAEGGVSKQRPENISDHESAPALNLYLYKVSRISIRAQVPIRAPSGIAREPAAPSYDLDFLLSASGVDDLSSQLQLGAVLDAVHTEKRISPLAFDRAGEAILEKLRKRGSSSNVDPPQCQIRIEHLRLEPSEMALLFSQTPYRRSVAIRLRLIGIPSAPQAPPAIRSLPEEIEAPGDEPGAE